MLGPWPLPPPFEVAPPLIEAILVLGRSGEISSYMHKEQWTQQERAIRYTEALTKLQESLLGSGIPLPSEHPGIAPHVKALIQTLRGNGAEKNLGFCARSVAENVLLVSCCRPTLFSAEGCRQCVFALCIHALQRELELEGVPNTERDFRPRIRLYAKSTTRDDHLQDFLDVVRYCGNCIGARSEEARKVRKDRGADLRKNRAP